MLGESKEAKDPSLIINRTIRDDWGRARSWQAANSFLPAAINRAIILSNVNNHGKLRKTSAFCHLAISLKKFSLIVDVNLIQE